MAGQLRKVEELLLELNRTLDRGPSGETKRKLVELLVAGIRIESQEEAGRKQAHISIRYRFPGHNDHTDAPAGTRATW